MKVDDVNAVTIAQVFAPKATAESESAPSFRDQLADAEAGRAPALDGRKDAIDPTRKSESEKARTDASPRSNRAELTRADDERDADALPPSVETTPTVMAINNAATALASLSPPGSALPATAAVTPTLPTAELSSAPEGATATLPGMSSTSGAPPTTADDSQLAAPASALLLAMDAADENADSLTPFAGSTDPTASHIADAATATKPNVMSAAAAAAQAQLAARSTAARANSPAAATGARTPASVAASPLAAAPLQPLDVFQNARVRSELTTSGAPARAADFFLLENGVDNASGLARDAIVEPFVAAESPTVESLTSNAEPPEPTAVVANIAARVERQGASSWGPSITNESTPDTASLRSAPVLGSLSEDGGRAATPVRSEVQLRADPHDEIQLARRLYRLVRSSMRAGDSSVKVRLDPPTLGRVNIEVKLTDRRVKVRFQVESEEVRGVIQKHLDELQRVLDSFGEERGEIAVDLHREFGGDAAPSDQDDATRFAGSTATLFDSSASEPELELVGAASGVGATLDLHV
ncbi:MAG: flagellar hook-length control protein FliK [Planctomycetota bacterium]